MTHTRQRILVVGLAAAAGALDSWSYVGLAQIFIANMTGNTVLLGASLAMGDWPRAAGAASVLACYALGVAAGTWLSRTPAAGAGRPTFPAEAPWPRAVTAVLAVQLLLLVSAVSLACWLRPVPGSRPAYCLVAAGAASVGLQSAAVATLKLPGVMTTYITGTWTTMIAGMTRRLTGSAQPAPNGRHLRLQAAVLAVYCSSAAGAVVLMRIAGRQAMGWLPVGLLALVTAGAFAWDDPGLPAKYPANHLPSTDE